MYETQIVCISGITQVNFTDLILLSKENWALFTQLYLLSFNKENQVGLGSLGKILGKIERVIGQQFCWHKNRFAHAPSLTPPCVPAPVVCMVWTSSCWSLVLCSTMADTWCYRKELVSEFIILYKSLLCALCAHIVGVCLQHCFSSIWDHVSEQSSSNANYHLFLMYI